MEDIFTPQTNSDQKLKTNPLVYVVLLIVIICAGLFFFIRSQMFSQGEQPLDTNAMLPEGTVPDPFPKFGDEYVPSAELVARTQQSKTFIQNPEKEAGIAFYVSNPNTYTDAISELTSYTKDRTEGITHRVNAVIENPMNFLLYDDSISAGALITQSATPKTKQLLDEISSEIDAYVAQLQIEYSYKRPSQADTSIEPTVTVPQTPSIPNDIASDVYVIAELMRRILPDFETPFTQAADTVAILTSIVGINYPRDGEVSKHLVYNYFLALDKNNDFNNRLAEAKAEWENGYLQKVADSVYVQ